MLWLVLFFALFSLNPAAQGVQALSASSPLKGILQLIETRRNQWTAFQADVTLNFRTRHNEQVSCQGNLTYHRLDERILLNCFDTANNLMFAFKTYDEDFELYIPPQNTKVHGNIFDLEDSPDIDAYLKPLDLYRALKPMAVFENRSMIESWDRNLVTLSVQGSKHLTPYLQRRLYVTFNGDILKEVYYSFSQSPFLTIYRRDFEKFKLLDGYDSRKVFYPRTIVIESHEKQKSVVLSFAQLRFFSYLQKQDWTIPMAPNTEIVSLAELNPATE